MLAIIILNQISLDFFVMEEIMSYYGLFFLSWYSQTLVNHADRVLMLARLAFEGSNIAVKVSCLCYLFKANFSILMVDLWAFFLVSGNLVL